MKNNQSNRLWKVSLLVIGFVHIQKKLNLFQKYSIKSIFFQKILTNFKKMLENCLFFKKSYTRNGLFKGRKSF